MARPQIKISEREVLNYARFGATNCEIAAAVGCDEEVIRRRFPEILAKGREERKRKLRRKQYEVAMRGNVAMLIWLGKQDLGQSEKQDHAVSHKVIICDETERPLPAFDRIGGSNGDGNHHPDRAAPAA